jgi:hypothetical protein
MQDAARLRCRVAGYATGASIALATLAAVASPASARAGGLTVPHAAAASPVLTPQASSPAPAPPPSSAPAQPAAPPPPSLPPAPTNSAGGSTADPEESLPGADVPPLGADQPYPGYLPSPFGVLGSGCDLDCLQTWHDWYFDRIQTVRREDPDAAELLSEEKQAIDQQIRDAGGVPGEGTSDVVDEPGDDGPPVDGAPVDGGHSASPGPGPGQAAAVASPASVVTLVADAISGAGPIVPETLSLDLGPPLDLTENVWGLGMVMTWGMLPFLQAAVLGQTGTTACPKAQTPDGKVSLCKK